MFGLAASKSLTAWVYPGVPKSEIEIVTGPPVLPSDPASSFLALQAPMPRASPTVSAAAATERMRREVKLILTPLSGRDGCGVWGVDAYIGGHAEAPPTRVWRTCELMSPTAAGCVTGHSRGSAPMRLDRERWCVNGAMGAFPFRYRKISSLAFRRFYGLCTRENALHSVMIKG